MAANREPAAKTVLRETNLAILAAATLEHSPREPIGSNLFLNTEYSRADKVMDKVMDKVRNKVSPCPHHQIFPATSAPTQTDCCFLSNFNLALPRTKSVS